ncbi:MAG: family 78 glycoside hydrolase catalytic domain [Oscillospiraceae bacterium]|nr:family 78 glycoside hydrolase catalytic domain [Oscillospiraceae bacterium]
MIAIRLRTEYLKDPLGIDIENPRLTWNCDGGLRQTAYRIVTEKWDSGKVSTSSMSSVYPMELRSREHVTWKICIWDENDVPGEWAESFFEMGLLEKNDWTARWITGDYTVDKKERYPVDCFRRSFSADKEIKSARMYITACGLYEARLNGRKIGDFYMAPGHTDYRKRIQYQTYDVTELVNRGDNELTVQLADGWYRGSIGAWGLTNQYGTETKLLCQLEIEYFDGSTETVISDKNWEWSNDGPIRFADNKDGETVEAFREPLYGGHAKETKCGVVPSASDNVHVIEHECIHPVITVSPNGKKLLDFGQNLAGIISFRVRAHAGQKIFMKFGVMLGEDGNLTLKNIQCVNKKKRTPLQQIDYTCGEGLNEYKMTFSVFGFRYAEADTELVFSEDDIEAIAVYSDMEETGSFRSSNKLLNKFVESTKWSTKSNSLDVPTDCPTRERHGWTGDAQIFFGTASYLFDYAAFARKYLRDVYDWQRKDGRLPQIAPYGGVDFYMWTMNGSVGWSDVGILMPYFFWKKYGDDRIIRDYYDHMKKYASFMEKRISKDGIVRKGQSYGEWAEPADVMPNDWKDMVLPHPEVSTAYTAYVLKCMSEIGDKLGHVDDSEHWKGVARKCRMAYQREYGKDLDTDRQAQLVRPLAFGLLDDEQTAFAQKRLIKAMENYGWRLGTGFLSTPLILDVLADIDIEAAYRLLENEEMPGWLFMPKAGATTIWESWEGTEAQGGIASLNHYSKGAACEWLYRTMCGIRMDGENHFRIEPHPGGHFTYAEAEYRSIYGTVKSGWERNDNRVIYRISIPANCTATLVTDGKSRELEAGTYEF